MKRVSHHPRGFTLVELLVVIGIIALLISILLPALSRARSQATVVNCLSNIRQLSTALVNYATENKGKFPPNIDNIPDSTPRNNSWFDVDRIGRYLPKAVVETAGLATQAPSVGGTVMVCPVAAGDDTARSYSMNYWASSKVSGATVNGILFSQGVKQSSKMILVTERWPERFTAGQTRYTRATIGAQGTTAGQRFLKILPSGTLLEGLYVADTELDYSRHRLKDQGTRFQARGRVVIGFVDGHAELLTNDDLAGFQGTVARSRLRALWSPKDVQTP